MEDLMKLVFDGKNGATITLPQGYSARYESDYLSVFRAKYHDEIAASPLNIPGQTLWGKGTFTVELVDSHGEDDLFVQHFDADRFPDDAEVRTRKRGDRILPLGAPGHMSLKKAMSMRKIPVQAREEWPILAAGERVLWVPGGNLMDKDIACREKTRRLLKIQYHGEEISYYGTYSR